MTETWTDVLMEDHQVTDKLFAAVRTALQSDAPPRGLIRRAMEYITVYLDGCHNKKEEEHLFPLIERRGIPRQGGPLAVMLMEHEQSREMLTRLGPLVEEYLAGDDAKLPELRSLFEDYSALLQNHFWKENDILYPMARRVLSDEDARAVMVGIEATEAALGEGSRQHDHRLAHQLADEGGIEDLSEALDRKVMAAILNTLPVELSFVDENDEVQYFSHEDHLKIFPRTRGVVGTKVQECHPPKSVHMVNQILRDFKAGTRKEAEFWIDFQDKFVHIRYYPVRSPLGKYLGCLEVVQDVSGIRRLEGERRLLDDAPLPPAGPA